MSETRHLCESDWHYIKTQDLWLHKDVKTDAKSSLFESFLTCQWIPSPLCHKTDPFIVDGGRHYLCNITWMKLILACFVWSEVARKPRWLRGKEETSVFVTSIPVGYICCIQGYQRQVDPQLERIESHYTKVFLMMLTEECWRVYWIPMRGMLGDVGGYRKLSSLLHW